MATYRCGWLLGSGTGSPDVRTAFQPDRSMQSSRIAADSGV
ncbi:hypothetical protein [Streptomyces nitrosporeus]